MRFVNFVALLGVVVLTGCQDSRIAEIKSRVAYCKSQNIPYEVNLPPDIPSSVIQFCDDNDIPYVIRRDVQAEYARAVRKISDETGVSRETVRKVYKGPN
jgi:hypothetical protein